MLGLPAGPRRRVRGDLRARALSVRGGRYAPRPKSAWWSATAPRSTTPAKPAATGRSTCRWTCCSARRRRCTATPAIRRAAPGRRCTGTAWTCARPALRVLAHPTVASKNFLVTIGDRTVGGLTARDQMIGPWQLPLADCAITLSGFDGFAGEAMAIGERTPLALLDAAAAGAHGRGRGDHQPVRRAGRIAQPHQAVGQLDGRCRPSGRGRAPVRRGQGRRHGAVPGARPQHSGRQGFAVDAGAVAAPTARSAASRSRRCR